MSTPAGKFSFFNSSTVLAVGSMMSSSRLCVRISNCSMDFLSTCGERFTVNFSINGGSVTEQFGKWNFGMNNGEVAACFDVVDGTAAPAQVAADVSLKLVWRDVFDLHDRLQQNRFALFKPVFHREDRRHLKCKLVGIDFVKRTVNDIDLNIDNRITAQHAVEHGFVDAFFDGRNVFARNDAADNFVFDNQPGASSAGTDIHFNVAVLTAAT